jgi:hypothetical protein
MAGAQQLTLVDLDADFFFPKPDFIAQLGPNRPQEEKTAGNEIHGTPPSLSLLFYLYAATISLCVQESKLCSCSEDRKTPCFGQAALFHGTTAERMRVLRDCC